MTKKIIGWILLVAGLLLIGWTLMNSYNIFTGEANLPEFFELPEEKLVQTGNNQDIQAQLQQMMGEQLKGMIPVDSITKILNLTVWSILAFILIFGGTQIAGIGIKLIKS